MNECPQCGFQNSENTHICLNCASTLKQRCKNCGAEVPYRDLFCGKCGSPLTVTSAVSPEKSSPAAAGMNLQERMLRDLHAKMPSSMVNKFMQGSRELYGQRREVTVLIVEISDFLQITRQIDSESTYLAVDEIVHLLADIVYKYEGTIDKYSGNGLIALFGLPINHENDPERAVRAALEMVYSLNQLHDYLTERYQCKFQIQVGINTGSVIAGALSGHQHLEYTVIGDTMHMALNLQKFACAGSILVSFSTYQRTRPIFDYQSMPQLLMEGSAEQVVVYQPSGIRAIKGMVRGLPGLQVPMVGRSEKLGKLIEIFNEGLETKNSEIVFCSGDAGIGKSRLVAEFKNYLSEKQVVMVQGTCALYMRITPYRVVADVLRNILGISELDPVLEQRKTLRQHLEQYDLDRSDILPYLMQILGILHSDPISEVRIKLLDPSMLHRQTHFALRMFFIAQARKFPLVLVFDDLHWVDQPSGQFLEFLCQSLESSPILLIMVARDFEKYAFAKALRSAAEKQIHKPHDLYIHPLTGDDAQLLVDQLIQEDTKHAQELKRQIITRAGGNPYYTEELVRILIDHGGLIKENGSWHLTNKAARLIEQVPGTLSDIILARFDHLPEHLRSVLLKASILGDSYSVRLLQALMGEDVKNLSQSLIELEERQFLIHTQFDIEDGYIFKHPLLSETIYKTLLKRDLKVFHGAVAQAIETGEYWLPGERNQVLAYHLSESSRPARAIPYFLVSAEKARQHFANHMVVQLYRQALTLMDTLAEPDVVQKEKAQVGLAQALKFTGEMDEASHLLINIVDKVLNSQAGEQPINHPLFQNQIDALCELADIRAREGDLDYAVRLLKHGKELLGESGQRLIPTIWRRVVDRLAWVYFRLRNLDEAYNLVDLALQDTPASETEDPITMASLYNTMGGIYWTRSRYAEAIDSVEHSLEIYKNLNYHWGMANALANLGILHYSTDKWSQAVEYLEQADLLRREYGDDPERPINLENLGEVLIDLGEFDSARNNLETSREISQRLGLTIAQTHAEFGLCRLAIVEGRLPDARQHIEIAAELIEPLDENNDRVAQFYQLQAMIDLLEENFQEAKAVAEQAVSLAQRADMPDKEVDALRILGSVMTRTGAFVEAEQHLKESIRLALSLNDRFCEAKAHYELAVLYWNWDQRELALKNQHVEFAERSLETAVRIFESLGAKHELQRANNLRILLPTMETFDKYVYHEGEAENQMILLRARLHIPEGEWYPATVFSAIMSPKRGAEDELIFETTAFLIPSLAELIRENGGQVIHHPDGITAIFGAPITHEDDPERAVETMMQIVNFYYELDQQTELPVSIQLGVATGKIVAGKLGTEHTEEFTAAGEPLQLARMIAEACPPGQAWVTQAVYNHTAFRFEFTPVPSALLEASYEKTIFQFEGLREQILPVRGFIGLKTPFIGRENELQAMVRKSRVLESDTGGIIWIEGEAGIGKSRLMREFSKHVASYHATVLGGVCSARRSDYAFSLFTDLLMQAFEIQYNFTPQEIIDQIDRKLNSWSVDLVETRPFMQLLLGVQPSGAQGERVTSMEPEQLRRQTFVAIHRIFSMLAQNQPLVLILDDLQWIDSISADLLLYLSHLVVSRRILFVCAQRQKEISPHEQTLARTRSMHPEKYIHLSIHPLTITQCEELLHEFLAFADLPPTFLSLIVQQSGGNPYFIEEFVRLLIEKDFLRLVRGKLVANQKLQADALVVPASLESLIRARVDSLNISARHLLQIASIIGHRFNGALLSQVSDRDDNDLLLSQLHTSGMLTPTIEEDYWEFSHPLIEVIVYNSVLRAQRRILHYRTAQALESRWREKADDHAEDLAYHFRKAEEYQRALHYLIVAGERAASRHANDVAVSFFEQATELLNTVPEVGDEARWRIIHQMGEVYQFIGNYDTSLAVLQSGLDLLQSTLLSPAQRAGFYRRMGDTLHKKGDQEQAILYLQQALETVGTPYDVPSQVEAALIYARLGWCYFFISDFELAKESVNQSMVYAGLANNVTTLAMAENYLGGIYYRQGDLQQAMQHTRTAMAYWQEIGYSWGVAAALSNLGILESVSGNWKAAFNSIKRSLELRQKMGDVDGVAITNHNLGQLVRSQGDVEQAEQYYRDSLAVSRPFQMNWHAANSYVGLAQSLLLQGKIDEASAVLEDSFRLAQEINAPDVIIEANSTLAEILLAKNELAKAEERARTAINLASEIGTGPLLALPWRLISAVALRQGQIEKAGSALVTAWQALAAGQDQLEDGRLHAQAALVAIAKADVDQAKVHYQAADQIFTGLGASRDLAHLKLIEQQISNVEK
jgi:predicted ATPase/class 3 adenylate cyclase/Tfp pilus assembly protein PilF